MQYRPFLFAGFKFAFFLVFLRHFSRFEMNGSFYISFLRFVFVIQKSRKYCMQQGKTYQSMFYFYKANMFFKSSNRENSNSLSWFFDFSNETFLSLNSLDLSVIVLRLILIMLQYKSSSSPVQTVSCLLL